MNEKLQVYKYTTYVSVAFIVTISIAFGVTIYQLQVGIKKTINSQLKNIREELNATVLKATSRELSDSLKVITSELEKRVETIEKDFPKGSLMAFDRNDCPTGWEKFEQASGRVIVASGKGINLSKRTLGEVGGVEFHVLTSKEMPPHVHDYIDDGVYHKPPYKYEGLTSQFQSSSSVGLTHGRKRTNPTGGGQPYSNMPPYYVVTLCRKTN